MTVTEDLAEFILHQIAQRIAGIPPAAMARLIESHVEQNVVIRLEVTLKDFGGGPQTIVCSFQHAANAEPVNGPTIPVEHFAAGDKN